MAQFSAQCPHCRVRMKIQKPELAGKTAKCPSCKEAFVIQPVEEPAPASKQPASAPPAAKRTAVSEQPKAVAAASRKSAKPRSKPAKDVDFPVEQEEVYEAEEIVDEQPEEDWLKGLDALSPADIGRSRSSTPSAAPPIVRGRQKHAAPAKGKKRRKRNLRDADGELPLWMSRSLTVLIGSVVGGVTMLIWAGLIAKTGVPSRWMAMFIGATVGTGIRLGASKYDFGLFPAVTAALIALTAVIGGKVWGFNLVQRQAVERDQLAARYELKMVQHENYPLHLMAEEIHDEYIDQDLADAHHFYSEMTDFMPESEIAAFYDPAKLPDVYGEQRWKEAKTRWDALTDERRAEVRETIAFKEQSLSETVNADVDQMIAQNASYREGGALNIFDFIFAGIAVVGAFKIAAGMADSAIDTSEAG